MPLQNAPDKPNTPVKPRSWFWWIYLLLFLGLIGFWVFGNRNGAPEITWKQFEQEMLADGDAVKVNVVNKERVEVYLKPERLDKATYKNVPKQTFTGEPSEGPHYFFNIGSVGIFHEDLEKAQKGLPEAQKIEVTYSTERNWGSELLVWLLPIGLLIFFWVILLRGAASRMQRTGSSIFSFGQSKARVMEKGEESKVTFADVAGLEEAKEEIYELVKFLKAPERFQRLGAKIPKGVLLVGPPGTGKTLLAKAVAGEAGVPFFSLSGSEFTEMFVGVGAARMRDLFQKAKSKAPSIIFIDEIDTVGRTRGKAQAFQGNDERENTLQQLLSELDGFDPSTGVIVLAATNRGDVLDPALLRPGRFDRHIHLELPGLKEREAIFEVHMGSLKLAADADAGTLAAQTPGFSGADIANICNEAALIAARGEENEVKKQDFLAAIDRVVGGLEKRSKIITPEEKRRVAYHEAGHVTTSWFLEHAYPVQKVSIIPRGRSLGAAWYLPEEHQIVTRSEFFDTICLALGGRVSEELVFPEVSSNALDDLERVTKQAYNMVVHYGLSEAFRNLSYYDSTGRTEQSLQKPYSEKTAEQIDREVQRIVDEAWEKTRAILESHRKQLDNLANLLIEKETVHKEEIRQVLGERPFAAKALK